MADRMSSKGIASFEDFAGEPVDLIEIKNHNHWYYDKASKINEQLWSFLKKHELTEEPQYEQYEFKK